jgi:AcrR family transcriptional regulator
MGTAERRQRERSLRTRQIQEAAQKVFLEKGFYSATIEHIAREAELSIGTTYLYFKTKEELFASLNLKNIETYDQGLDKIAADPALSPEDKLRRAWVLLKAVFCQTPLNIRALVHGQLQGSLQNISQNLLANLNRTGKSLLNKLAGILEEGMDQGFFVQANPMALADIFWGSFTGVVTWEQAKRTTDKSKEFLDPTLELALETFIRGIRVE